MQVNQIDTIQDFLVPDKSPGVDLLIDTTPVTALSGVR